MDLPRITEGSTTEQKHCSSKPSVGGDVFSLPHASVQIRKRLLTQGSYDKTEASVDVTCLITRQQRLLMQSVL